MCVKWCWAGISSMMSNTRLILVWGQQVPFWTLGDCTATQMDLQHIPQAHHCYLYYPSFPVFPDILGVCYPIESCLASLNTLIRCEKLSGFVSISVLDIITTNPKSFCRSNTPYLTLLWLPVGSIFRLPREQGRSCHWKWILCTWARETANSWQCVQEAPISSSEHLHCCLNISFYPSRAL